MARLFKFKQYGKREPAPIVEDGHVSLMSRYVEGSHPAGTTPSMEFVLRVVPKDFKMSGEWGVAMSEDEAMLAIENLMRDLNAYRAERRRRAIEKFKQERINGRQS